MGNTQTQSPLTRWICGILAMTLVTMASLSLTAPLAAQESAAAPAIHVILVVDLKDTQIGVGLDLKRWREEVKKIELNTQTTPTVHEITDRSAKTVTDTIENLNVGSNDTIVFFYGGHAFNKDEANNPQATATADTNLDSSSKWPELRVFEQVGQYKKARGLPLWRIFNKLKTHNPRLLLVLGDCCNDFQPKHIAPPTYTRGNEIESYYKTLYLTSKGRYIASAAKPGQKARGNRTRGGFFTERFFDILSEQTSYDPARAEDWTPSWDHILENISQDLIYSDPKKGDQQAQWERVTGE